MYDALPPRVRQALANAAHDINPHRFYEDMVHSAAHEDELLEKLRRLRIGKS
jgi:hypothetical protein